METEITYKNNILYKIVFNKRFFNTIDNVKKAFKDEFIIIEFVENKTTIMGKCYKLVKTKEYNEKIMKRYDQDYNKFTKLYFVDLEIHKKIAETAEEED